MDQKNLLGPDELSWKFHNPNVSCAHMCVNFEESEYAKGYLDYSYQKAIRSKYMHRSSIIVEPKKSDIEDKVVRMIYTHI